MGKKKKDTNKSKEKGRHDYIPTGIKVKSAILFSMVLITLSRPLARNVPELVRTLCTIKVN